MGTLVAVCQIVLATQVPACSEPMSEIEARQLVGRINQPGSTSRVRTREGLSRDEMGEPFIVRDEPKPSPFVIIMPNR